ncbi:MAG TPA: hypothetical protein DDW54_02075 [Clostridiales bacterium]|nr:hypothetical protein [Clostridiales bacterium]
MFFFDDKIKQYEQIMDYDTLLLYLEEIFWNDPNEILPAIIGYAWYFSIEGNVNVSPKQYNYQTYLNIWKKYIDIGLEHFTINPVFDFIAGYSLSLHGMYLDFAFERKYEKEGLKLMKKCVELSKDISLGKVAENFLINAKSRKRVPLENGDKICKELFNGDSVLDKYFSEIYAK